MVSTLILNRSFERFCFKKKIFERQRVTKMSYTIIDCDFKNWIIANLGLMYTKKLLEDFVKVEVEKFHRIIKRKVQSKLSASISYPIHCRTQTLMKKHCGDIPCQTSFMCDICRQTGNCVSSCINNVCQKLQKEIKNSHSTNKPTWSNTNASLWADDYWEVGKCFLPKGYADTKTIKDTDCTGLLTIMIQLPDIAGCLINIPNKKAGIELLKKVTCLSRSVDIICP